jgi:hypothetical protein
MNLELEMKEGMSLEFEMEKGHMKIRTPRKRKGKMLL